MGRISREECERRRNEILDVAADLYETLPFKDINIKEIGSRLSFTRTAIYTYFDNKEEIFLALLEREYLDWEQDLQELLDANPMDKSIFAWSLAQTLEQRFLLLKILTVDMAAIDANSRMTSLIAFKKVYGRALELVGQLLAKNFPERSPAQNLAFVYSFFPFLYGVYPYTEVTEKQREAMAQADVSYQYMTVGELIENCILQLL